MNKQTNISRNFWLQWVMTNAIAWLVGFGVIGNLVSGSPLLFGILFGAIVGIMQFLSTEKRIQPEQWLIANIVGWATGSIIAIVASRTPYMVFKGLSDPIFYILFGAIGGGCSATLQYFLQWHRAHHSYTLIFVFIISNVVAGLFGGYVVGGTVESALASDQWILIAVGSWIVGGALFGAITAFPMIRLQRAST